MGKVGRADGSSMAAPSAVDHRYEVLVRGERLSHAGRALAIVEEGVDVAAGEHVGRPGVELGRPGRDRRVGAEVHRPQVVRQKAAADDEHPFAPQRRQRAAEGEQLRRVERRQGDLKNRHVGGRVHADERHVGAVVEPPIGRLRDGLAGEEAAQARRQLGRRRRRIGGFVVLRREAGEVVDQRHATGGAERDRPVDPVRGEHQDRARTGQGPRPRPQLTGPALVVQQQGGPVRQENSRHRRGRLGHGR